MRIVVSGVALLGGIALLAAPNPLIQSEVDEGTKRLAAGWVGAVIGYWLS